MISKKHLLLGIFMVFLGTSTVLAQFGYYEDALRFSQFRSTGSARIIGLGGAQMSLGGDISNIHTNPAREPAFCKGISRFNRLTPIA